MGITQSQSEGRQRRPWSMAAILACLLLTALAPLPGPGRRHRGSGRGPRPVGLRRHQRPGRHRIRLQPQPGPGCCGRCWKARGLHGASGEFRRRNRKPAGPSGCRRRQRLPALHSSHDSVSSFKLTAWNWMGEDLDFADEDRGFALFISHRNPRLEESLACASAMGAGAAGPGLRPRHPPRHHRRRHAPALGGRGERGSLL